MKNFLKVVLRAREAPGQETIAKAARENFGWRGKPIEKFKNSNKCMRKIKTIQMTGAMPPSATHDASSMFKRVVF